MKYDGDFTVAKSHGPPRKLAPLLPWSNELCVIEQKYRRTAATFAPLAINTPYASGSSFLLAAESSQEPLGPLVEWTRVFTTIPATFSEPENFSYNFIGFQNEIDGTDILIGRERRVQTVQSRIEHKFFRVVASGHDSITTFASVATIPKVSAQKYYFYAEGIWVDALSDGSVYLATTPSTTTYKGWATAGTEIVAEDSRLRIWMGNVYERLTRYIVAQ